MHFEHRRKWASAFRTVKAGEQRGGAHRAEVFEVFDMDRHLWSLEHVDGADPTYHIGGLTPSFSAFTRLPERLQSDFF